METGERQRRGQPRRCGRTLNEHKPLSVTKHVQKCVTTARKAKAKMSKALKDKAQGTRPWKNKWLMQRPDGYGSDPCGTCLKAQTRCTPGMLPSHRNLQRSTTGLKTQSTERCMSHVGLVRQCTLEAVRDAASIHPTIPNGSTWPMIMMSGKQATVIDARPVGKGAFACYLIGPGDGQIETRPGASGNLRLWLLQTPGPARTNPANAGRPRTGITERTSCELGGRIGRSTSPTSSVKPSHGPSSTAVWTILCFPNNGKTVYPRG